jgi:hypothetical protein
MPRLGRAAVAGLAYAIAVFLIGSVLGVVRVLALEPRFGALDATIFELPLILGIAWLLCTALTYCCEVAPRRFDRLFMGGLALLVLAGAELGVGALIGRSPDYGEPAALLGLAGQLAFALLPLVQARFFLRRDRALP